MSETLDLAILDSGSKSAGVVLGRSNNDIATVKLPYDKKLEELVDFKHTIDRSLRGQGRRPTEREVTQFGRALFDFCIRDQLSALYSRLPQAAVSVQILCNNADIQALPWEFMQAPKQKGPNRERSIVRIVPTVGTDPPQPKPLRKYATVLFAAADPVDQDQPVDWLEVKDSIKRTFESRLPEDFRFITVEAVTPKKLTTAIAENKFDIFHFSGHGEPGRLILENRKTSKSHPFDAYKLANTLRGRARLVILSACDTSAGDFSDEFGVTAAVLIQNAGIPAVVANQLPIPDSTVATFVGSFYRELIDSGNIDSAMSEGRIMLSNVVEGLEWGIPTLYRHFGASQLYKI